MGRGAARWYQAGVTLVALTSGCAPAIGVLLATTSGGGGGGGGGAGGASPSTSDRRPPVTTLAVQPGPLVGSFDFTMTTDEPATIHQVSGAMWGAPIQPPQTSTNPTLIRSFGSGVFVFYAVDLAGNRETVQAREYVNGVLVRSAPDPAVRPATDVNGDGYADLVVGAPGVGGVGPGQVLVFFGGPAIWNSRFAGDDTTPDLVFTGEARGDSFGASVVVGDLTGDGVVDLAVGAPSAAAGGADAGRVLVFVGPLREGRGAAMADVTIGGAAPFGRLGFALAAGDLDGDGVQDLACGAPADALGATTPGQVLVVRGGSGLRSGAWWRLGGAEVLGCFGFALATGDVTGDGRADLVVGAQEEGGAVGSVYVFTGGPGARDVDLASGGSPQATFRGAASGDLFGWSVAVGDVAGDGASDLVVGAPGSDAGAVNGGAVHVFRGPVLAGRDLGRGAAADDDLLVAGQALGRALTVVDANDDGRGDVLASGESLSGPRYRVHLFPGGSGLATTLATYEGSVASGLDLNGDGLTDVALGNIRATRSGLEDVGEVRTFMGGPNGWVGPVYAGTAQDDHFGGALGR